MAESVGFQTKLHALVNGLVDQQAMPDDWWQDLAAQVYDEANNMIDRSALLARLDETIKPSFPDLNKHDAYRIQDWNNAVLSVRRWVEGQ